MRRILPTLSRLRLPDAASAWRAAGFCVSHDGVCRIGSTNIMLEEKIQPSWTFRDLGHGRVSMDGVSTLRDASTPAQIAQDEAHPNDADSLHAITLYSPSLSRTVVEFERAGLPSPKRVMDPTPWSTEISMAFVQCGDGLTIEVVAPREPGRAVPLLPGMRPLDLAMNAPAQIAGLIVNTRATNLDALQACVSEEARGKEGKASQGGGRRRVVLRHEALGLATQLLFLSAPRE